MKQKDRVRIVREAGYKGYDKSPDSKCENPQKYEGNGYAGGHRGGCNRARGHFDKGTGETDRRQAQALCTHFSPPAGGTPGTDTGGSNHMWIWHGAALA